MVGLDSVRAYGELPPTIHPTPPTPCLPLTLRRWLAPHTRFSASQLAAAMLALRLAASEPPPAATDDCADVSTWDLACGTQRDLVARVRDALAGVAATTLPDAAPSQAAARVADALAALPRAETDLGLCGHRARPGVGIAVARIASLLHAAVPCPGGALAQAVHCKFQRVADALDPRVLRSLLEVRGRPADRDYRCHPLLLSSPSLRPSTAG